MLKFGRLYIHFLTVAMFIFFYMNGHICIVILAYISMLLHEGAHLIAALGIGLRVSRFALYPFGVNLRLKNKMISGIADEVILYLSGPCVNLMLALCARGLCLYLPEWETAYRINILLFTVNMLPILPLDGGCIVKRLISGVFGTRRTNQIMKAISSFIAAVFIVAGVYAVYVTGYNYSVLIMAAFIIGNIFTQTEKYNTEYLRELMFYRNKPLKHVSLKAAYTDEDLRDIAKGFLPCSYSIVCRMDRNGKIKDFVSETQVLDDILGDN